MAALHSALQTLAPTPFSSIPSEQSKLRTYLQDVFLKSQVVIESVPPPSIADSDATRARSNTTTSIASNASEISASSARSDSTSPEYTALQKEWGKPIKPAAKDNQLGMAVYKLSSKDGKGAWFARRSVHEGLGFSRWKKGLEKEFPETLKVQGGPGEGNIRGIGGEKRVEDMKVDGVGKVEVYHLTAQFPGPTTPRDFVTLLLTSSTALKDTSSPPSSRASSPGPDTDPQHSRLTHKPRHFMVVSKPCVHPDCPPRDGFIRGEYESVEFIREIPRKPLKSSSTSDLSSAGGAHGTRGAINKEAMLRNAQQKSHTFPLHNDGGSDLKISEDDHVEPPSTPVSDEKESEGRRRGKTISFAGSRGRTAKGEQLDVHQGEDDEEEAETNPVEWIMITRSDPGGSVPRWMVERGTPGSIVADAGKFLDWACQKDHAHSDDEDEAVGADHKHSHADEKILRDYQTNGHLSGIDRNADDLNRPRGVQTSTSSLETTDTPGQGGMIQSLASAAYAGLETYAPKVVVEHLPGHRAETDVPSQHIEGEPLVSSSKDDDAESSISEASSVNSFASADSHLSDEGESKSVSSKTTSSQNKDNGQTVQEKELAKLNERKRKLDEKLAKTREKELKDREELTSKEQAAIKKAEEKHTKEVAKQEEKYKKEVAKLEAKKAKEAAKLAEKKKRAEDKDEKARLVREKEEVKAELDVLKKEREILKTQVGELQKENTALAAQLGKASNGRDLLKEVREEIGGKGWRSRSSSMESGGPGRIVGTRSRESTLLGKESPKSTGG